METKDTEALRLRNQKLTRRYEQYFAGHPRHSRDPSMLDDMVGEANSILESLKGLSGDTANKIGQMVRDNRTLYQKEAAEIRRIHDSTPDVFLTHEYRAWTRLIFDRYQRNFAGRSRADRDVGLLVEMISELERLSGELSRLEGREGNQGVAEDTRERIDRNLELYRSERLKISETRDSGTPGEQADMLAAAANVQFEVYTNHYASKERNSRSVGRLQRSLDELGQIAQHMKALAEHGLDSETNERNMETVARRMAFYEGELAQIKEARAQTNFDALVASFGRAANQIFDQYKKMYAGEERQSRELSPLAHLCEGLWDLAIEMDRLDRVRENDSNQHNLAVVFDHLRLYHREYVEIDKIKKGT